MNLRLQGIGLALGELAGTHLERELAELVMLSLGITFDDLVNAGTDPHDLEKLKGTSS
jgi:hypothetical protein